MWSGVGLLLAFIAIAIAVVKSKRGIGGYYEREVYGMTRRTHAAYALISAGFAAVFLAAYLVSLPVVPLLAAYVVIFVFYVSSFARGFSDEE